jgi:hypothetical protein
MLLSYNTYRTLHTVQCGTLHSVQYVPYITYHTIHTVQYIPHNTYHTIHTVQYVPHNTYRTIHTTQYIPYNTYHTIHTVQYMPHNTYRTIPNKRRGYFTEISAHNGVGRPICEASHHFPVTCNGHV